MKKAEEDPQKYSKYVLLPPQDQTLVGCKIEVRMQMFKQDDEGKAVMGDDGKQESFLHCFEGTVEEIQQNESGNSRRFGNVTSKWAIAKIRWDVEFLEWGAVGYQALNPDRCEQETKNGDWNVLNQEYLAAVVCAADRFMELREQFKDGKLPEPDALLALLNLQSA
jgi:hypothetical protein